MSKDAPKRATDALLWAAYQRDRSEANRNAILMFHWHSIELYMRSILRTRRFSSHLDAVLSRVAERTLSEAIPRFDPGRGIPFWFYLLPFLHGCIQDEHRSLDPMTYNQRTMAKLVGKTRHELACDLGRRPTDAEVADHLGISESTVIEIKPSPPQDSRRAHRPYPNSGLHQQFENWSQGLTTRSAQILWDYYFMGYSGTEIGRKFRMSPAAVSMSLANIRQFLREKRKKTAF